MLSESAAEDIDDTDEGGCVPFDCNSSVDFIIPEAWSWDVESTIGFLHYDAVGYKLEVFVDCCNVFENLSVTWCVHHHRSGWSRFVHR